MATDDFRVNLTLKVLAAFITALLAGCFIDAPANPASSRGRASTLHVADVSFDDACGEPAAPISAIQGTELVSPLQGSRVVIEAVVAADLRASGVGLFVQEDPADDDGDPASSEGLLVSNIASAEAEHRLLTGSRVRVDGVVHERDGITALEASTSPIVCPSSVELAPSPLAFPIAGPQQLESLEGMLVQIPDRLTVTGNFELGRYGSLDLAVGGRLFAPTQLLAAGAAARARQEQNDRSRIVLDDASFAQNPSPVPYLDADGTCRIGDEVSSIVAVLDDRYGAYRLQPVQAPQFERVVTRPRAPPPLAGRLRVASLNVLNYFTTLDAPGRMCGVDREAACRGANTPEELVRQRAKLVSVLAALDADIYGLLELQNDGGASLADLVAALNERLGSDAYAFLETGVIGDDVIASGFVYRTSTVSPRGAFVTLTRARDPGFDETWHRPALAQTFVERASAAQLTLVLTHLKSKSSPCGADDPDLADGQGACNRTRTSAARALARFVASDPTASADPDVLVFGDFNAYAKEDPIAALEAAGLRSLVAEHEGATAYSYVYDGQAGDLDHAFATSSLAGQVTGVAHWHIAADEPPLLDYNLEYARAARFDPDEPFRASDHDPLLIALDLPRSGVWPRLSAQQFVGRVGQALRRSSAR